MFAQGDDAVPIDLTRSIWVEPCISSLAMLMIVTCSIALTESGFPFGQMVELDGGQQLKWMPPLTQGRKNLVLPLPIIDFDGPPGNWGDVLRDKVVPLLQSGKKVAAFCAGSHGRTGTLLASLIAILEPGESDPVLAARTRHCAQAVETTCQKEAIAKLQQNQA